ncbi:MAG: hypothetical protein PHO89_09250 [Methylacidiphilaceae bacterium]|nr:hypothetical protein [Candidatus Methylacidiphilaceae bacterium]
MNRKLLALLGALLLGLAPASGFAGVAPKPHPRDPLDHGVESLDLAAERIGQQCSRHAQRWNRAILPFCLAVAIGIAAWRVARGYPSGKSAANVALYLLLALLLSLKAPEALLHPTKGLLPRAARLAALHLARLSPEGAHGMNARQWWRSWLGSLENPGTCKLSPTYAREKVLGFPEGGSTAHRFLVNQAREALVGTVGQDVLPGRKLENALDSLLLLAERKFLKLLLLLCLILLGIGFFLFSLLHLLFCGGSTLLWELLLAVTLVALPLLLVGTPPRFLRLWLQLFLLASLSPVIWHLLAATSYLGLTTIFASIFGERGLFGELRETGAEMLKGWISKKSLLLAFWSLAPEMPRMIFLGLYERMAGLVGFCTVAVAVCSTLFLGAVLPMVGLWWAIRRKGRWADSLIAGWTDLHREIALAATALGACFAAWVARLENERLTPAVAADAPVAASPTVLSRPHSPPRQRAQADGGEGEAKSLS